MRLQPWRIGLLATTVCAVIQLDAHRGVAQPFLVAAREESPQPLALQQRVDQALETVRRRYLTAGVHSPWQIMHGVLALGQDMKIREGEERQLASAIEYICQRAEVSGRRILEPTAHGLRFIDSYHTEGHPDQFLAILGQAGVPAETLLHVGSEQYKVADLLREAQAKTGERSETTWTIIAMLHYLGPDAEWRNQYDQRYTLRGLVKFEVERSVESGACGGTHRLGALSLALARYRESGAPIEGVWARVQERTKQYLDMARSYQNSDGSFSTEFFYGPGSSGDLEDRLHAHGHTLEWVSSAVEAEELAAPWVTRAVENLCDTLLENRRRPLECGSLYHAASALRIYRARRWKIDEPPASLAGKAP